MAAGFETKTQCLVYRLLQASRIVSAKSPFLNHYYAFLENVVGLQREDRTWATTVRMGFIEIPLSSEFGPCLPWKVERMDSVLNFGLLEKSSKSLWPKCFPLE